MEPGAGTAAEDTSTRAFAHAEQLLANSEVKGHQVVVSSGTSGPLAAALAERATDESSGAAIIGGVSEGGVPLPLGQKKAQAVVISDAAAARTAEIMAYYDRKALARVQGAEMKEPSVGKLLGTTADPKSGKNANPGLKESPTLGFESALGYGLNLNEDPSAVMFNPMDAEK